MMTFMIYFFLLIFVFSLIVFSIYYVKFQNKENDQKNKIDEIGKE